LTVSSDDIVRLMGNILAQGEGAYFLGSGISVKSGLPNWFDLMKDIAHSIRLILTKEDDLTRIAQYSINASNGNRGPLYGYLKRALSPKTLFPNPYHEAIKRTNIKTIWTTNFDTLLEKVISNTRLVIRANDIDITSGIPEFDIELLKIHGCIDHTRPDEIVLTQEDFENFSIHRPALSERLKHDLLKNSILFIGYSYRDPNISTILVEARRLSSGITREHFFITKLEKDPYSNKICNQIA